MKLIIFLWLAFLAVSLNAQSENCIETECPSLYEYDCAKQTCVHKEIFPLTFREICGAVLIVIFSGLCTSGGMGGGGVYTPILLIVFSYESSKAIMLVYSMIFGGSLGNFMNVAFQKDIETGKPVILYDFALIVTPMMVLGSTFGILVNKVIASVITICALLYVVQDMARKIYKRAKATYAKESNELASPLIQEGQTPSPVRPQKDVELAEYNGNGSFSSRAASPCAPELEKLILEEQEAIPKKKLIFLFSIIGWIVIASFLRGTEKFDSLLGVNYCSTGYWIFYLLSPLGCYLFYLKGLQKVQQNLSIKAKYNYKQDTFTLKQEDTKRISLIGLIAGFLSAIIGGGGGMFLGPPMLAMGVGAQSMTATCGLFTVLTSLANLIQAFLLGGFSVSEFVFFFSISTIGAYTLSLGISYLVKKYKRPSILLFILAGMLFLNLVILPGFTVYKSVSSPLQMFQFHSLC